MRITSFTINTACNKDDPVTQYTWITDHSALLLNKVIRPILGSKNNSIIVSSLIMVCTAQFLNHQEIAFLYVNTTCKRDSHTVHQQINELKN